MYELEDWLTGFFSYITSVAVFAFFITLKEKWPTWIYPQATGRLQQWICYTLQFFVMCFFYMLVRPECPWMRDLARFASGEQLSGPSDQ